MMSDLTKPQLEALHVLSRHDWCRSSNRTHRMHATVNGGVARRLVDLRLAKYRYEAWGREINGAELGRLIGAWHIAFAITRAGRSAIGRPGRVPRGGHTKWPWEKD